MTRQDCIDLIAKILRGAELSCVDEADDEFAAGDLCDSDGRLLTLDPKVSAESLVDEIELLGLKIVKA